MHFDPTVTWGTVFTGLSFLVAVIVFIVAMKPRIDNIEKEQRDTNQWKRDHELLAHERDRAIQNLTIEVTKIATFQMGAEQRIARMESLFEKVMRMLGARDGER